MIEWASRQASSRRRPGPAAAWLSGLVLAFGLPTWVPASPLSAAEARGKALYFGGIGAHGRPVKAYIGEESSVVEGDAVPCAGCHGEDGRGGREGAIVPSDITWSYLTKPYGHRHGGYRNHPAVSEKNLATLLSQGIDPGGNRLDSSMPRFALSHADMVALVAYLKRLDSNQAAGVDDATIRLGTILPISGPEAHIGRDLRALLTAYFDEINSQGGLFNRRIEIKVAEIGATAESTLRNIGQLTDRDEVFAMVSAYMPGLDLEVAEFLEKSGVPLVGPIADFPKADSRTGFYLFEGIEFRAFALLDYAASLKSSSAVPRLALVVPEGDAYRQLADKMASAAIARGWPPPIRIPLLQDRDAAHDLTQNATLKDADSVFFLGSDEALTLWVGSSETTAWLPYFFMPGSVVGAGLFDLPASVLSRLIVALPFTLESTSSSGLEVFRALQRKSGIGDRSLFAEAYALAGAQLLVQALKHCGRDLGRKKLLTALEGPGTLEAPPMPSLSYSAARHLGLHGARIVSVDPRSRRFQPLEMPKGHP